MKNWLLGIRIYLAEVTKLLVEICGIMLTEIKTLDQFKQWIAKLEEK